MSASFQFTRPRGARRLSVSKSTKKPVFQFTRPRGARLAEAARRNLTEDGFNSRAREGRDKAVADGFGAGAMFQFTRPRGARLKGFADCVRQARFNSRAREGRDASAVRPCARRTVSIHAPARGATVKHLNHFILHNTFQFTRPRGARRRRRWGIRKNCVLFQFTRPRGARQPRP